MNRSKPFLFPIWMLGILIAFRLFIGIYTYHYFYRSHIVGGGVDSTQFFKSLFLILLWPVILAGEIIIYWKLRQRSQSRFWTHMHVWCIFIPMCFYPVLLVMHNILSFYFPNIFWDFFNFLHQNEFRASWVLIGIGHIFFIATIVKSFSAKKVTIVDEQTSGLLDEFAD